MNRLFVIIQKEFRQIRRNPAVIRLILVMPVMQLILLPHAADYEIKNINLHVNDYDRSTLSRRMIDEISASGYFRLTGYGTDRKEALQAIERDRADLVLTIPAHFERTLVREDAAPLMLEVNAINGVKAGLGGAYMNRLLRDLNNDIRLEWTGYDPMNAPGLRTTHIFRYNATMEYTLFMVPGILVLLLTLVGMNLTAINLVREREIGTIEQVNVSPIRKHQFILGKLIPQFLLGMLALTMGLTIARIMYGITPAGGYGPIYLFAMVYMLAVLGIGMIVSNQAATQQQAMLVSFFIMMIFVLMSGLYTSIDSMPEWAKWITRLNPVTYFIEVMRRVVLKGAGVADIAREFRIMGVFATASITIAIVGYHKRS
jgi:ABC-2 type transport system permease protein